MCTPELAADNRNRRRWQQDGMIALLELLPRAETQDLPPIPWTILTVGALLGRAGAAEQVASWADFLGASVTCPNSTKGGPTYRCETVWRGTRVSVVYD
jgi:hypothetical protein